MAPLTMGDDIFTKYKIDKYIQIAVHLRRYMYLDTFMNESNFWVQTRYLLNHEVWATI